MAATDLVPCFYTGQDYRLERPVEVRTRAEVRELKAKKLGKFVDNGKLFLFFKTVAIRLNRFLDGPLGTGNLLPFAKPHNYGDRLHYEMPMAGDRTTFARHRRKLIHVSGRIAPELRFLSA
jgi:hypothetical protein